MEKIIERAAAGAAREAVSQASGKALGLAHLNEMCAGMGHRAI